MMTTPYHREDELRRRINAFIRTAFALPDDDYYSRLDLKNLLLVKSALSDINNTLTMRLTLSFLNWASQTLKLDAPAIQQLRDDVLKTKPSSNGYDVCCAGSIPFIAEVKCNIPINGGKKYGSAQRIGIFKDVDSLLRGKTKATLFDRRSLKFMVFVDLPEVRAANEHLLSSSPDASKGLQFLKDGEVPRDSEVVYGVYTSIEA
jgi:hypothetical protein